MRGVLERLEGITAVRDAGITAPRKAEFILMDMEIVQLVGAVDQLPYLAAMLDDRPDEPERNGNSWLVWRTSTVFGNMSTLIANWWLSVY
jgi:hypothetical protein